MSVGREEGHMKPSSGFSNVGGVAWGDGEGHLWLEDLRCMRVLPPLDEEGGRGCQEGAMWVRLDNCSERV